MNIIMFNDRCNLTELTLQGYKNKTRRAEKKMQKFISDYEENRRPFEIRRTKIIADGNGGYGLLQVDTPDDCFVMPTQYKVGEIVAVAQCYKNAGIDPHTTVSVIDEGQNMFTPVPAIDSVGWTNKMFVRADLMQHHIKITGIDLERLQDISDEDCLAEGVLEYRCMIGFAGEYVIKVNNKPLLFHTPRKAFAALIDKVSGKGTWESNPWVVVYDYKVVD